MLERWTRVVLRYRLLVLTAWLAVLVVGMLAAARLPGLLATSFVVPGTESERASRLLAESFGERPEGTFVVVFDVARWSEELGAELAARLETAARIVPTGRPRELRRGAGVVYGEIATTLDSATAKDYTDDLRDALAADGPPRVWVTGNPAIQHDVDPVLREDRRRAELVATPVALAILVAIFGLSLAVAIPLVFAACTVTATLALVYVTAHVTTMTTFAPTLVELIGLGLAIDYSLLVVHRFREEAATGEAVDDLVVRTMETAGRAIVVSGSAVAIGLALLLVVPIPLIRSMGIAGFLVPVVSIAAVLTLQPVLLSLLASRGKLARPTPGARRDDTLWARLARAQIRRPLIGLGAGLFVLAALSVPALWLTLAPNSIVSLPRGPESLEGFARLTASEGAGAVTPTQIVVDTGAPDGSTTGPARAAIDRLADRLFRDPEVFVVASGSRPPYVDESARRARVIVIARHEFGAEASRELVGRIRETLVPAAGFPPGVVVAAGGLAPQGVDFLDRAYAALPWVILAVVAVTYVVLLRAFRSLVLPLEAVVLNLLTVAAVCGLLVMVFQWGIGDRLLGLRQTSEIEAWVPIFLFATLFGLSMDYEVFYVSRMREAWDESLDSSRAVVAGLARSGRVVTAAAAIMIVAFSGFVAGRLVGLQQLGLGLAAGILVDATLVRLLVLPSLMALLGRWNWWLPAPVARIARVEPSPLQP